MKEMVKLLLRAGPAQRWEGCTTLSLGATDRDQCACLAACWQLLVASSHEDVSAVPGSKDSAFNV